MQTDWLQRLCPQDCFPMPHSAIKFSRIKRRKFTERSISIQSWFEHIYRQSSMTWRNYMTMTIYLMIFHRNWLWHSKQNNQYAKKVPVSFSTHRCAIRTYASFKPSPSAFVSLSMADKTMINQYSFVIKVDYTGNKKFVAAGNRWWTAEDNETRNIIQTNKCTEKGQ